MARKSVEARMVLGAQQERVVLAPPRGLSAAAKAHWTRIVGVRPADFFTEGNLQLLEVYCRMLVQLDRACAALEAADPSVDAKAYAEASQTAARINQSAIQLATKLRLTIQSALRGESAKNSERVKPSPLLGGKLISLRSSSLAS